MKQELYSEALSVLRSIGHQSLRSASFNLRNGLIVALFGALAILLFRPETTPDETAVFVVVPFVVFLAVVRVLGSVLSRMSLSRPPEPPEERIRLLSLLLVIGVFAAFAFVPSFFIYRSLGVAWAGALAIRLMLMLLAGLVTGALYLGMRLPAVYQFGLQFLRTVIPLNPGLIVLRRTSEPRT